MSDSIFREKTLKKISSPEELHDYIRISNPAIWTILCGILVLLAALFVWVSVARLDTTLEMNGIVEDSRIICYTGSAEGISVGQAASIGDAEGTVASVSRKPVSLSDISGDGSLDEYTLYCLRLSEWNYVVEIETDTSQWAPGEVVSVSVITDSVSPITFLFG